MACRQLVLVIRTGYDYAIMQMKYYFSVLALNMRARAYVALTLRLIGVGGAPELIGEAGRLGDVLGGRKRMGASVRGRPMPDDCK